MSRSSLLRSHFGSLDELSGCRFQSHCSQKIQFLGFTIDLIDITIQYIVRSHKCITLQIQHLNTTFDIQSVFSICATVKIGKLHHKDLEKEKNLLLRENAGNCGVKKIKINK